MKLTENNKNTNFKTVGNCPSFFSITCSGAAGVTFFNLLMYTDDIEQHHLTEMTTHTR